MSLFRLKAAISSLEATNRPQAAMEDAISQAEKRRLSKLEDISSVEVISPLEAINHLPAAKTEEAINRRRAEM